MKKSDIYREERNKGLSYKEIAEKYGVSKQMVGSACRGCRSWGFRFWSEQECVYPNVRKWINDNGITCAMLMRMMDLEPHHSTYLRIRRLLSGKGDPRKKEIDRLLSITGFTYEKFFYTEHYPEHNVKN